MSPNWSVPLMLGLVLASSTPSFAEPWRVFQVAELPDWLELSGHNQSRIEYMSDQFRAGLRPGSDQILSVRTGLVGKLRISESVDFTAEFLDVRAGRDDDQTALNTSTVNATDWLQFRLDWRREDLMGGDATLRLGRMTIDLGSRRLVSRNIYRATINAFTGVDVSWKRADTTLRAFSVLPVHRRSADIEDLRDNNAEADRESLDVIFWGTWLETRSPWGGRAEVFVLGLHEQDSSGRPTRNRKLYTPGVRMFRKPAPGALDFDFESVLQFGKSRATTASTAELDHLAHFHRAELGYSFEAAWTPRLSVFYDFASGDGSASDSDNNRFDTLFGVNRGDYGPPSIYRTFIRSNNSSPGVRLKLKPTSEISAMLLYRLHWLASDNDAWTAAGIVDPSGGSDRFVGSQIELGLRWELIPGNLRLEAGLAHLFADGFADQAPNSSRIHRSTYAYFSTILWF